MGSAPTELNASRSDADPLFLAACSERLILLTGGEKAETFGAGRVYCANLSLFPTLSLDSRCLSLSPRALSRSGHRLAQLLALFPAYTYLGATMRRNSKYKDYAGLKY